MRHLTVFIALGLLLARAPAQYIGATPVDPALRLGFESITPDYCKEILTYLAGPECEGRQTGTAGYQKAADFVAAKFKEFGLKPVGDNGTYFQGVPFPRSRVSVDASFLSVGDLKLLCGKDVGFEPSDSRLDAPVVFVSAPVDAKLDDSKILRNRFVVLLQPEDGGNPSMIRQQMFRDRPRGTLQVVENVAAPGWSTRRASRRARGSERVNGFITKEAALRLAKSLGIDSKIVTEGPGETAKVASSEKEVRIIVEQESEDYGVPNVVGLLEGSDPELKEEIVACGSHLDHLGKRSNGVTYFGADDDGSGCSGLVALARALTSNPRKPKRSILFLAFCGEEMGLIGSRYYANNPIFPLKDLVCELQMDMIGRNEETPARGTRPGENPQDNVRTTHLVGSKRLSMDLHAMVLKANEHVNFDFEYDEESVYERSDHYSFAQKGVPIAFFFSGFHPDYHKPTDTVEKINFEKLANTARLVYLVASEAANRKARVKVDKGPFKTPEDGGHD